MLTKEKKKYLKKQTYLFKFIIIINIVIKIHNYIYFVTFRVSEQLIILNLHSFCLNIIDIIE